MPKVVDGSRGLLGDHGGIILTLEVRDPRVVDFLTPFEGPERIQKALEALRFGVIALQMASPTLDTQLVKDEFGEVENRLKDQCAELQKELGETLAQYFKEEDGVVHKSLNGLFGKHGSVPRILQAYFDPQEGRVMRLIENQIGPSSQFGKALDPNNKKGLIATIEDRVTRLVEDKLETVLREFSLDEDGSALSRFKAILSEGFADMRHGLGIKSAQAEEAERGHVK